MESTAKEEFVQWYYEESPNLSPQFGSSKDSLTARLHSKSEMKPLTVLSFSYTRMHVHRVLILPMSVQRFYFTKINYDQTLLNTEDLMWRFQSILYPSKPCPEPVPVSAETVFLKHSHNHSVCTVYGCFQLQPQSWYGRLE